MRPAPVHLLRLDESHAVRVSATGGRHRAQPVTADGAGWARASAGDGAGFGVLHRLRSRSAVEDGFRVTASAWVGMGDDSERAMGVDQTNESWVVGDRVVVKWVTDDLDGPHAASGRMRRLADVSFDRTPALVGLLEWANPGGDWVPVTVVQEYLPGAEDGWTWVVAEARRALGLLPGEPGDVARRLGELTGAMHLALAGDDVSPTTTELAAAQAADARAALAEAVRLTSAHDSAMHALLVRHRDRIEADLGPLDDMAGRPSFLIHGDLHVGQMLRTPDGGLHVVDFDGNPTRPAALRAAPGPAARDVAGMLLSLENVGAVVRHHDPSVPIEAVDAWVADVQEGYRAAYVEALGDRRDLFDEHLVPAFDWEQVCREAVYAGRHLPAWRYVPAAAVAKRVR